MGDYINKLNNAKDQYINIENKLFRDSKWKVYAIIWLIIAVFFFGWNISLIGKGISYRKAQENHNNGVVSEESGISEDSFVTDDTDATDISEFSAETETQNVTEAQEVTESQNEASVSDYETAEADTGGDTGNISKTIPANSHKLFIDVKCAQNLLFNLDDIDIIVDGQVVGHVPHGWEYTGFVDLSEGEHVIKLDSSSSYSKKIKLEEDATFKCYVTVDFLELDIDEYGYTKGITTDEEVYGSIPGTYYGVNGSGLVIFADSTAQYFYKDFDEISKECYWYYKDGKAYLKLNNPACKIYAYIKDPDINRITLLTDNPATWKNEDYLKISSEVKALSIDEYKTLIENGDSQARVMEVVSSINNLGNVTAGSKPDIDAAREMYESLDDDSKSKVDNLSILEAAEELYNAIAKDEIEKAISEIPEISLENEKKITDARKKYDEADETVQSAITNYDLLVQAEAELSQLKAQRVTDMIAELNIDQLTVEDGTEIRSAEREYDALSAEEQQLVENYSALTDAKEKLAELEKEALERKQAEREQELKDALAKLTKDEDKVANTTYYKPSTFPKYLNSKSCALPYLAVKGNNATIKLRLNYYGSSWVFWTKVIFAVDDERYTKEFGYYDVSRDIDDSGNVFEHVDINVGGEELAMLKKIVDSEETIVRFQGEDYKYDLTLSKADKKAIGELIDAYYLLKAN